MEVSVVLGRVEYAERLEEIKNYPISYEEDSPKLTKELILGI